MSAIVDMLVALLVPEFLLLVPDYSANHLLVFIVCVFFLRVLKCVHVSINENVSAECSPVQLNDLA